MPHPRSQLMVGGMALVAALGALCALPPLAAAACGGTKHVRPRTDRNPGAAPLAIGDSVLLGALGEVSRAGFEIDTRGCRQMSEGLRVLRRRRAAGRLPRFVVMALGTNLSISPHEVRRAVATMGRRRVLGLVTPREDGGGSGRDAAVVRAAGRRFRKRVLVLDWVRYSRGHSGWFAGDGIHLGRGGAAGLARLLGRGLRSVYPILTRWSAPNAVRAP